MTKKRILIVEDQGITALDEAEVVRDLGYEVTGIAITAEDAVIQAGRDRPDLILMDIKLMGKMDGREATLIIQELHNIPVIYVTAHVRKGKAKSLEILSPGEIGYVCKPFTEEELVKEIERLIG